MVDISWELAEQIAEAIHKEWDDEQVDTAENINDVFPGIDEIGDLIMARDAERAEEGWGKGRLNRSDVNAVLDQFLKPWKLINNYTSSTVVPSHV